MLDWVDLTVRDVEGTKTFQEADDMLQGIYRLPLYVKAFSGWVTVAKYKGLEHMLNIHHMNEFKRGVLKELFESKVENAR